MCKLSRLKMTREKRIAARRKRTAAKSKKIVAKMTNKHVASSRAPGKPGAFCMGRIFGEDDEVRGEIVFYLEDKRSKKDEVCEYIGRQSLEKR
ncbi:hypothetical protein JS80_14595 [Anoxybacillus sp. KU2-6(11)]|nr:hypothetical protein JS80_14595 [Anoxybacillus sp. KU2-6(11)]